MQIHAYHVDYTKYKKMLAIHNSCLELGIPVPVEVSDYIIQTKVSRLDIDRCIRDIGNGCRVINVKDLPPEVETIAVKE